MMNNSQPRTYTYDEYLTKEFISEHSYELEAGKIKEIPPESHQNIRIALYLIMLIIKVIGRKRISNKIEIIISGTRVNARVPDVTVLSEEGLTEIHRASRSTITLDMLPPLLVIEVVSPGKINRDRDYRYKRSEYAARGIAHYWIVDPQNKKFVCLELIDRLYEEKVVDTNSQTILFNNPFNLEVDLKELFS